MLWRGGETGMERWNNFGRIYELWYEVSMIAKLYVAFLVTLVNKPCSYGEAPPSSHQPL